MTDKTKLWEEFEKEEQEYRQAFAVVDLEAALKRKKTAAEKKRMEQYQQAAKDFIKKEAQVNLRISKHDLNLLKHKANMESIPYQTLLTSLVSKYVNGKNIWA